MFGFFKGKPQRTAFDDLSEFVRSARGIIHRMDRITMAVIGYDSGGNHIQCWLRPHRKSGLNSCSCTESELIEWATRSSNKVAVITKLSLSISGYDEDNDYRSFDHQIVGEGKARQCLRSIMSLDATAREATRILEITQ